MSEQIIQTQSFYNSSDITLTLKFQESSGQSHFVINNHSISLKIEHTKSLFQLQGSGSIFFAKSTQKNLHPFLLAIENFSYIGHTPDIRKNGDLYIGHRLSIVARKNGMSRPNLFHAPRKTVAIESLPLQPKKWRRNPFKIII